MKNLCIITTGGTIASERSANNVSVSDRTANTVSLMISKLSQHYGFKYDIIEPMNKNSEDFSFEDLVLIINSIKKQIARGISRIIVVHGTDTLHFSATAAQFLLAQCKATICFTGAFLPINEAGSDAQTNLTTAINTVCSDDISNGVYVALRKEATNDEAYICGAMDFKPLDFDDMGLHARGGAIVGEFSQQMGFRLYGSPRIGFSPTFHDEIQLNSIDMAIHRVRYLQAYIGLNSHTLAETTDTEVIIISAYHSGTVPSNDKAEFGITNFIKQHPEKLVVIATHPSNKVPYLSVLRVLSAGAVVVREILPHQLYLFCVLKLAQSCTLEDIRLQLHDISMLLPIGVRDESKS